MKIRTIIIVGLLAAGSIAATAPAIAHGPGSDFGGGRCGHHPAGAMLAGDISPFGSRMHPPPVLRELNLSDAQHDKIFKIMHDLAPALREKAKEASKAHYELQTLVFSDKYDEARVRTLSETSAQAMAAMVQMRAASLDQIYQTLTPDQRKKADEFKNRLDNQTRRRPMPAPGDERPAPRRP